MTDAHELTIKQILDSAWVRRIARVSMIVLPIIVSGGGGFIGWVMWVNAETSKQANATAAAAVSIAEDVKDKQDERAVLADVRAVDSKAWQDRLDAGLTRINQRVSAEVGTVRSEISAVSDQVGELKGDIGELKGLIIRQTAAEAKPSNIVPFFAANLTR